MTLHLIKTILITIIGFLGAVLGGRYSNSQEKQITARKTFEKCYSPIFELIENKFYSTDLSLEEYNNIGKRILIIIDSSGGYYYNSLKIYAKELYETNNIEYAKQMMHAFSWSFDKQYAKVCSKIGIPKRSRYYRINTHQYEDLFQYILLTFFDSYFWINWIYILLFAMSILFLFLIS